MPTVSGTIDGVPFVRDYCGLSKTSGVAPWFLGILMTDTPGGAMMFSNPTNGILTLAADSQGPELNLCFGMGTSVTWSATKKEITTTAFSKLPDCPGAPTNDYLDASGSQKTYSGVIGGVPVSGTVPGFGGGTDDAHFSLGQSSSNNHGVVLVWPGGSNGHGVFFVVLPDHPAPVRAYCGSPTSSANGLSGNLSMHGVTELVCPGTPATGQITITQK